MTLSTPFSVTQIGDQGPSHGLKYTDSTTFSTTFRYQISPALDSSNEFYQKQCGTWNGSTGYISGSTARNNGIEHESGTTLGHYQQYVSALGNPSNNPGAEAESYLGGLSSSLNDVISALSTVLGSRTGTIVSAMESDSACNSNFSYSPSCAYNGPFNYSPYDSCNIVASYALSPLPSVVPSLLGNGPAAVSARR
jgi:hypothetical protein